MGRATRRRGSGRPPARSRSRSWSRSGGTRRRRRARPASGWRPASEPACGSVRANAPSASPGDHRPEPALVLLRRPPGHDRVLRQDVDRERHRHRHVGRPELLHHERPADVAEAGSTDRLGSGAPVSPSSPIRLKSDRSKRSASSRSAAPGATSRVANSRAVSREEPLLLGQRPAQGAHLRAGGSWAGSEARPGRRIRACRTPRPRACHATRRATRPRRMSPTSSATGSPQSSRSAT